VSDELRIGDAERESAMKALGEHLSAGRLDLDEYGDRTAQVATAKTRGELTALFTDLPRPHPEFGPEPLPATTDGRAVAPRSPLGGVVQRGAASLTGLVWIAAIVAIAFLHVSAAVIFIPIALSVCFGGVWGKDWRRDRDRDRDRRRDRHRDR